MRARHSIPCLLAAALCGLPSAFAAGCDAAAGEVAFGKCAACHSRDADVNIVGPSLHGLSGRKAGTAPGFTYSPAIRGSGITWDMASLDQFITDPQAAIAGNRMPFTGIKDPIERANLVCFLIGAQ